ncbi:MAG: lipopolysaccharide heptosyltransferase II [Desulfobacteraceae bacterium]|nr:lipopolysaccharide heptosyltransferase II [Desulfobacteraceae bacterium]
MRLLDGNFRKILVRSTNWIGDAVMTTPAMGAVRSAFPSAEIVLLANPLVSELMSPHPYCDRVIVYDKKGRHGGVRGLWRLCAGLARERFDLAVLFQNAIEAAIIARLARIPVRAGYSTDGRGFLLTHSVPVTREVRSLHHTAYYLNLLQNLGIAPSGSGLRLQTTEPERAWAADTLGPGSWAAINPGAAYGAAKRWYPERFARVADRLASEFGFSILLVGGPGEVPIGMEIERETGACPENMIGGTSVRRMMALLERMDLVVTNDSGPMHVAAAFDRPVAALFGPTDHTTTSPLCSRHRIVRKDIECAPCLKRECPTDHRCMAEISVEDVIEAVRDVLGDPGRGSGLRNGR